MNDLLPKINELKPITDPNNTFYDCGFNDEFIKLTEKQKLQIICDIVRETILPNPFPNPFNELDTLEGNCHTACITAMNYLKSLNLCKSVKYVMVRKRKFDPEDIVSIHAILLVRGNDGVMYQFDPTPFVGYKYGTVIELNKPTYEEYVLITDEMLLFLNIFKEIIYLNKVKKLNYNKIKKYINICLDSLKYPILNAYCGNALKILIKYIDDYQLQNHLSKLLTKLRPYSKNNILNKEYQKQLLNKQVKIWKTELEDLKSSGKDIKRQLELSQYIIQELKMLYPEYEIYRKINDTKTRISFINPRYLYEKGLNTIMIKTSAFYLKKDSFIRNSFINKYQSTGIYEINLSKPTEQTGIKPMLFSHPLGETCIRSLSGKSEILLVESDPQTILKQKKELRENICGHMWNKKFIWLDDKPIIWDPFVTNLIHGTDNAPEASLHYAIGNPEHQNMTRFMYPNPKLEYKKKQ